MGGEPPVSTSSVCSPAVLHLTAGAAATPHGACTCRSCKITTSHCIVAPLHRDKRSPVIARLVDDIMTHCGQRHLRIVIIPTPLPAAHCNRLCIVQISTCIRGTNASIDCRADAAVLSTVPTSVYAGGKLLNPSFRSALMRYNVLVA